MDVRITVAEVLAAIERIAPASDAAEWDAVGLQIGDRQGPIRGAGVCHEVTDEVISAAIAAEIGLLITYHPLIFRPLRRLVAGPGAGGRAFRLAQADISLISVHTAWDVASGGAADALADAFGLTDVVPFGPLWGSGTVKVVTYLPEGHADAVVAAMTEAGAGLIGGYSGCAFRTAGQGEFAASEEAAPFVGTPGTATSVPETRVEMSAPSGALPAVVAALVGAHPYERPAWDVFERRGDGGFLGRTGDLPGGPIDLADLSGLVSGVLGTRPRVAAANGGPASRIAVMPGSGGDFLSLVPGTGADVAITGDVTHHRARASLDAGVSVLDPGHAPTERPGLATLYAAVCDIVPGAVDLGHIDPDPWRPPA